MLCHGVPIPSPQCQGSNPGPRAGCEGPYTPSPESAFFLLLASVSYTGRWVLFWGILTCTASVFFMHRDRRQSRGLTLEILSSEITCDSYYVLVFCLKNNLDHELFLVSLAAGLTTWSHRLESHSISKSSWRCIVFRLEISTLGPLRSLSLLGHQSSISDLPSQRSILTE